ncbi:MAG: beta-lactamase family protein [Actinomycetota bacterium]|nr:beta-lactamase family protein [Actinomycetota bacterium]
MGRIEDGMHAGLHVGAQMAVTVDGRMLAGVALGVARPGVPMGRDTLLPWFSATKALTAAAVLQQWERGGLDLDDPVAAHVPAFAAGGKERVSVRHLLTHTGGLRATDDWVEEACAAALTDGWEPGRRAAYRPRGAFAVLAEVVRRLDGRSIEDYVSEELFEPLGMADSWLAMTPDRHAAYGERMGSMHTTSGGRTEVIAELAGAEALARARPSLSGVGPMDDLVRFYGMLLAKGELDGVRVLSPQTTEAMCARHRVGLRDETFGTVIDWGLGVMVNSWHYRHKPAPYGYGDHASYRAFGHGGSQSSIAFADPEHALAVALVFNGMAGEAANHRRTQAVLTALYEDLGLDRAMA